MGTSDIAKKIATKISRSHLLVAIHACKGNERFVYLGGLYKMLKEVIADELESRGIIVPMGHGKFKGSDPDNICNRGTIKKEVRLEITRGLRDDLNKRQLISEAVQTALIKITEKVQPQRHEGTKI